MHVVSWEDQEQDQLNNSSERGRHPRLDGQSDQSGYHRVGRQKCGLVACAEKLEQN